MKFEELSDGQWEFIEPLLPPQPRTGRPRADDRRTINGILYVLITGCKWEDMPRKYGAPVNCLEKAEEMAGGGHLAGPDEQTTGESIPRGKTQSGQSHHRLFHHRG